MIDKPTMNAIAYLMDDDIREKVHNELAPCAPEEFLIRYLQLQPEFFETLKQEFNISLI